jgi:hypothetical protein
MLAEYAVEHKQTPRKLTPADLIRRNKLSGGGFQRLRARPRASPGNAFRLSNQCHDMRGPFLQRLLVLGVVIGAVIAASDTRLVAGLMIDRRLDDVRLHAKLAHAGRHRPAQIVQLPGRDILQARVQGGFPR